MNERRIKIFEYRFTNEKLGIHLNEKFQNLQLVYQEMTAINQNDRPDCKGILERKIQWGLEPSHLKDNPFVVNAEKCFEMVSLENYFISRFIKLKLRKRASDLTLAPT